jgi:hypothetical protein
MLWTMIFKSLLAVEVGGITFLGLLSASGKATRRVQDRPGTTDLLLIGVSIGAAAVFAVLIWSW